MSKLVDDAYAYLDNMPAHTTVDLVRGMSIKKKENGTPVVRIHYSAIDERDPEINPQWKLTQRAKYSSQADWDREQEIIDEAGGGERFFADTLAMYDKAIVIREPTWQPNPYWELVGGFDHGKTNPTVLGKTYLDFDGNMFCAGEYYQMRTPEWGNEIWQNAPMLLKMPDIQRARWVAADPSIFYDNEAQDDGTYTNINAIYRKFGVTFLSKFEGAREDLTGIERLNERWANLDKNKARLFIVCRNESDRVQPGLHPYDSPNLLWELKRLRRKDLSARQLMERNPSESMVDKNNHAWDELKYQLLRLPRAATYPFELRIEEAIAGLNPMSAAIASSRLVNLETQRKSLQPRTLMTRGRMPRK